MERISLDGKGIWIDGERKLLLCASLFYFRIPAEEWEDRIIKLKASGYNCVDAYFPWNFHEIAPGEWDFTGNRDFSAYLELLKKHGMYVVARPGPYICSEWDGGSIPAWVSVGKPIREEEPTYLAAVWEWYRRVLPVIARYQLEQGGTVVMMQLENELDFFDCPNPRAYMSALRDMARKLQITVPLFGCAGQACLEGATGWAEGVEGTFNFYGAPTDVSYGEKFHYYYTRMQELNRPLLITETSCNHLFLRRELAAGAKLIGPYNQVGGTNFGLTGSVNNWGPKENPLSFITTHYAGDNMIGSGGELHQQYFEGRRYAALVHTFGKALAGAQSRTDGVKVTSSFTTETQLFRLALEGGGSLVCIPNLSETDGTAEIQCEGETLSVFVPAEQAPFLPFHVPLDAERTLICATGELENITKQDGKTQLTFWTEQSNAFARIQQGETTIELTPQNPEVNGVLALFVNAEKLQEMPLCGVEPCPPPTPVEEAVRLDQATLSEALYTRLETAERPLTYLESNGVYQGGGSYRFQVQGKGVLLLGLSDLVCIRRDGNFVETCSPAGAARYMEGTGSYDVTTFLWGHSNFADARQPALEMNAGRGVKKAIDIQEIRTIENNWLFSYQEGGLPTTMRVPQRAVETVISINSWNTTRTPLCAVYRKEVSLCRECDSVLLQFEKPSADVTVYVDGKPVDRINPFAPCLDLSEMARGKERIELELQVTKRDWGESVGIPTLYLGKEIHTCAFAPITEALLLEAMTVPCGRNTTLPLSLSPGEDLAVGLSLPENLPDRTYLTIDGKNIYALVLSDKKILGRVLLWESGPKMAGDPRRMYFPASWRKEKQIRLLILALDDGAVLEQLRLETVQ